MNEYADPLAPAPDESYEAFRARDIAQQPQQPAAPAPDSYQAFREQDLAQQRQRVAGVLDLASQTNPDRAAETQLLARQTGLPVDTVERNFDDVKRRAQVLSIDHQRLQTRSPILAKRLEALQFGQIAHDDVENLSVAEQIMRGFADFTLVPFGRMLYGATSAAYGLTAMPVDMLRAGAAQLGKAGLIPANPFDEPSAFLHRMADEGAAMRAAIQPSPTNDTGALKTSIQSGIESVPSSLAMGFLGLEMQGAKVLSTFMGVPVPTLQSLAPMGLMTAGQSYQQATEANVPFVQSLLYSAQQGGVEMLTEALPFGELLKAQKPGTPFWKSLGKILIEENVGEQVATHWQDLNEYLTLHPEKSMAEYLAERPDAALQTAIATTFATGMQTGLFHLANRHARAQTAQANAANLDVFNQIMAANKVLQRDPAALDQFLKEAAAEGPVQDFYIDAQTLAQSGLGEKLAAVSPSVAAQLSQALATNGQVRIPLDEYASRIAPTDMAQQLADHIRVDDPNAMNRQEATQFLQSKVEGLQAEVAQVLETKGEDVDFRASFNRLNTALKTRLNELGTYAPHVNELLSLQQASYAAARASQLGIGPEEFFAQHQLKIESERGAGAQFDQPAWHGSPYRFRRFDLSKIGTGEGAQANLYAVDIPDDAIAKMLDWDKPLSEQPEAVRNLVEELRQEAGDPYNLRRYFSPKNPNGGPLGADVYEALVAHGTKAGLTNGQAQQIASETLGNVGIPGLRYLDGQSRDAGEGTQNTVVWDQALLDQISDSMESQYNQAARVKTGPDLFRSIVDALGLTAAEVNSTVIEFMTGLPGDMAFLPPFVGGIPDVVSFLDERRKASGLPPLDIAKPEDRAQLARLVAAEALAHIRNAGDSLEWYDQTINATVAQMAVKYAELNTDPHARTALLLATAIASQGMNPETNLSFASEQYAAFRKTGKFPEVGKGESAPAMAENYRKANALLDEMGPELFGRFLVTPFTVKELKTAGFDVGGENMDELVLGSSVFGPKIGFGFFSNLNGNFEPVTMDMWFMRTIGRLTGTLPAYDPAKFANQLQRFRDAVRVRGRAGEGIFASQFDRELVQRAKTDQDAAVELARKVKKAHEKDYKAHRADYDSGKRAKSEMVLAADTIIQSMDKPRDVPASGGERQLLRDVTRQVVDLVTQHYGQRVPPAALQALIWYPEQELYSALGVKLAVTSQDYAGAARKLLIAEGFNEQDLDNAVSAATQSGSGRIRSADGAADAGTIQRDGQGPWGTGPLQADERTQFLLDRNARIIAEQRAAAARVNFEVAPDPDDLALVSRWRALTQPARLAISERVIQQILPKVLKQLKAAGELLPQVGSYIDDTNPSFALRLDKGDPAQVAKVLGFILSQDSMMVLAPAEFSDSFKGAALRVMVGDKPTEEIDQIYQTLRAIQIDGRQVIGGQSTSGGVMTILLDSQDSADVVGPLVDSALSGAYDVEGHDVHAAFPEKKDYDYGLPEGDPAGDEGLARQRARDARAQATDLLRQELNAVEAGQVREAVGQSYAQKSAVPNPTGGPGTAGPTGAGVAPVKSGSRVATIDQVPGTYARRTELIQETKRRIGVSKVVNERHAAQAFASLARGTRERFDALVTDKDGKPLAIVGSSLGDINSASVSFASIAAEAHRIAGAAYIWFGHNHPSGNPDLSPADMMVAGRLKDIFSGSGIEAKGIVAIAGGVDDARKWSFYDQGLMASGTTKKASAKTVPVVERSFTQHGTLGPRINNTQAAISAAKNISGGLDGLLLLDNGLSPVGFLPFDLTQTDILRRTGGVDVITRALSMSTANNVIVVDNTLQLKKSGLANLNTMLSANEVNVQDVVQPTLNISWVEKGVSIPSSHGFNQTNRGGFNPSLNLITLLKDADLSTFLHESGHYFFETDISLARSLLAKADRTEGEQQIVDDVNKLLAWHGFTGTAAEQLAAWDALDFEGRRAHHERTAEAYEAYLFEGKAPSLELEGAFRAFSAWLTRVYKSLKDFLAQNPEAGKLSDEVRGVFDRMLATEKQIRLAESARALTPLFADAADAAKMGLDPLAYQAMLALATQTAVESLQSRSLRNMHWLPNARSKELKKLQRKVADLRKQTREEVTAEVAKRPIYQVQRWLRKGEMTSPTGEEINAEKGFKLSTADLDALYPETMNARPDISRLRGMTSKEGLSPDLVAEMFGFASGDQMIREILSAPAMSDEVDGLTEQRLLEEHGDLVTPQALDRAADMAVHNRMRAKVLATELNALDKATGKPGILLVAAKRAAAAVVGGLKVKNLRPRMYGVAETKSAKTALEAFKAGDLKTAALEKRRQLFNHWAAQSAYEAQDEVKAILRRFRQIASSPDAKVGKTRNMDMVAAARTVLARHGYQQQTKGAAEYLQSVQAYDPATALALADLIQTAESVAPAVAVEELTIDQLRALRDEIEHIWSLAKRAQQIEIDGVKQDRDDIAAQLETQLMQGGPLPPEIGAKHAVSPAEERMLRLSSAKAWLRRVESWVGMVDGDNKMGPWRRFVFQPIKEAADRYRADKLVYLRKFRSSFDAIAPSMRKGLIAAPELQYTFGKDEAGVGMNELLHAILHTGNESNLRKLLLGRGWAVEAADGKVDTTRWDQFVARMVREGVLTREHFDFAQRVWDLLEETKPLAQKAHRDAYGRYFSEVTANEFEITLPDGTKVKYRGGYVPAMTDSRIVKDQELKRLVEEGKDGVMHAFPGAAKGFTKSRVEYNRPLLLDLRTLPQHIDRVLLFSHLEMPVRDAAKLLATGRVSESLNRRDPGAISQMLMPWLNRSARQQVTVPVAGAGWIARWINVLRNRTSLASMFANVSNAVQQITGFSLAAVKVKPSHLASAMAHYTTGPTRMSDAVANASVYMSNRMSNEVEAMMGEVQKILLDPSLYEQSQEWVKRHQFFLQSAVDNVMGPIIWTAAYNQSIEEGMSHIDAVRLADSAIRTTQGSTLPEDVSRIEAQNAFLRVFLQFAGYFNMQANLLGEEFGKLMRAGGMRKNMGRGMYVYMLGFMAPAIVAELIAQAFKGGPGDDDKDGEYLDDWLMALLVYGPMRNATAFVPGAGQVANSVVARFNANPTDDRLSLAPAVSMVEGVAGVPFDLYREAVNRGNHTRTIRDLATLITLTTGLPASTLARPVAYIAGVESGQVNPTGPVDAARGFITGSASPASR